MRPNQEADDCNGDARTGDKGIAEDRFARKRRNDLADYAHRGKNHDVNGRMRIEPIKKDADDRGREGRIRIDAAERGEKRPAGIQPASGEGIQNETAADHVDIPAEKIDLREG